MEIRSLKDTSLPKIVDCFNLAFSDYIVPFTVEVDQMSKRWKSCRVDYSLSYGAFDGDQLVGIIIIGVDEWQGKKTAYNSGTGVIPAYRGNRLVQQMYEVAIPEFRQNGIEQCTLEVIVGNDYAIKAYERVGFEKVRILKCFKHTDDVAVPTNEQLRLQRATKPNWELYESMQKFMPSWENMSMAITIAEADYAIWELYQDSELMGYIALKPEAAYVGQFATRDIANWKSIGQSLWQHALSLAPKMRTNNLDAADEKSIAILESVGMQNNIDQYEMLMMI